MAIREHGTAAILKFRLGEEITVKVTASDGGVGEHKYESNDSFRDNTAPRIQDAMHGKTHTLILSHPFVMYKAAFFGSRGVENRKVAASR